MEIIRSLKERVKELKIKVWLCWIFVAIILTVWCAPTFFGKGQNIWFGFYISLAAIAFLLQTIIILTSLEATRIKNRLALWQGVEDGKYKNQPVVRQMTSELVKAEEEFLRSRWNMNAFKSQTEKLQREIEAILLNK